MVASFVSSAVADLGVGAATVCTFSSHDRAPWHWVPPWRKVGEADNPGPHTFRFGTSNPSGLRGKEQFLLDHGAGIWHLAETQLSSVTQASSRVAIQRLGRQLGRQVRVHMGAPAQLRPGSNWAGAWSGTLIASDFASTTVSLPWADGAFQTERVCVAQHAVGGLAVLSACVYGYCSGPTHPDALDRTNRLLTTLTEELVLGRSGVRIIAGDFNQNPGALEQISVWIQAGWVQCQDWAKQLWNQEPVMTCKHATRRDMVYMSPEAASLRQAVMVFDTFQEHSTVAVDFSAALDAPAMLRWPMPSEVPWTQVDVEEWQASYQPVEALDSSTAWLKAFGNNLEQSLHGYVHGLPGKRLPKSCFGRCQHLSPVEQQQMPRPPRASRPGEEEIRHSLLCKEVQNWFRQLRRLQSLRHAVVAAKSTPAADLYRVQLWRSILGGKGFQGSFQSWWLIRPVKLQGSPPALPSLLPLAAHVTLIFEDFRENYRRLESWHLRRRHEVLKHRHAKSKTQLYHGLRAASPGQVDCLTVHRT